MNTSEKRTLSVGQLTSEELFSSHESFLFSYDHFTISEKDISSVKQWPDTIRIEVFFGTWCHDSQREVPRLLKLLNHNSTILVDLIGLDYQKTEPQGLTVSKDIKYTPTIIIYKNNKEVGRIIERPNLSLVADMTDIINRS
ncbi:MAG: thioredoxin family protein [Colwelliaceae bacterium]|nr:thioredoxin family protein [Colwelliaceae bacterium]